MKNSIFTIGIAFLAFTNVALASGADKNTQNALTHNGIVTCTGGDLVTAPQTLIDGKYEKTMEDIIAEDNRIIESDIADTGNHELEPVLRGKTIEEIIAEDNQIIESNVSTTVYPLDFKKINRSTNVLKMHNGKERLVGSL